MSKKFSAWLATAGAVIGVLAFFGITDFDKLKSVFDSQPKPSACQLAQQSANNHMMNLVGQGGDTAGFVLSLREYVAGLRKAIDAVDSAKDSPLLRGALMDDAANSELIADQADRGDLSELEPREAATRARLKWKSLCSSEPG